MKSLKLVSVSILLFMFLLSTTSCVSLQRIDNGHHKGWFKNTKNPHNPHHTDFKNHEKEKGKSHNKH